MEARGYLVLTAVGRDRPGIVSALSSLIHERGANLEDSRMAVLGGEFAVLMLVSGSEATIARVENESRSLGERLGLLLVSKRTTPPGERRDFLPYRLRVTGVDRPGIVHHVSSLLAARGVNVSSLDSHLEYAPLSGTPMFIFEARLEIPSSLALAELRRELAQTCDEENLDYALEGGAG